MKSTLSTSRLSCLISSPFANRTPTKPSRLSCSLPSSIPTAEREMYLKPITQFRVFKIQHAKDTQEFSWKASFFQPDNFSQLLHDIQDSLIYKHYAFFLRTPLSQSVGSTTKLLTAEEFFESITYIKDQLSGIMDCVASTLERQPFPYSEIESRLSDLPSSFNLLKNSKLKKIETYPYLAKRVGVHKLAILSSGVHTYAPASKILGYIGFLNILFLHDDIRIDSLVPSVYTEENKMLLGELHKKYMVLYDEVLDPVQNWSKDTSLAYQEVLEHSEKVDSAFGQPFFLGNAIVRFAQDVAELLTFLSNGGQHAKTNLRKEVNKYFLACEEEFENKIKGSNASFLRETQEDTIKGYLEIRRRNGAVDPCFEYVFLMHGLNIDVNQIPSLNQWLALRMLYVDHICIVNDLQSFKKELNETNPHNLVLILMQFYRSLEQGFSKSKEYFERLTQDITAQKQSYFDSLKTLLVKEVLKGKEQSTCVTLEKLLHSIDSGGLSSAEQNSLEHIKNAYKSILLMEQWADGHVEWEYTMRSKRHEIPA